MEKGKSIETPLTLLPEIIHHIQSFMSGKEAARSAILSKSWHAAWLTRPNIDLDEQDFGQDAGEVFDEISKKTMQRYRDMNLKIQSFRLRRRNEQRRGSTGELVANAIILGATHFQLEVHWGFHRPLEVLRSQTLLQFSLRHGSVRRNDNRVMNCSSLKSLTLTNLHFNGRVFKGIISRCVSMEELTLSEVRGLKLEQSIELHNLRHLSLCEVRIDASFFTNFDSRFPFLKDLTLRDCDGCNKIHIASTSIQTISFKPRIKAQGAKFDVPSIRKFTYSGSYSPSYLSINGASSWEWEFHLCMVCKDLPKTSWFMNLKRLLNKFRRSKISLFIDVCAYRKGQSVDVEVKPKPVMVDNLTIAGHPTLYCALLCQSFGVFRPKFVTLCDSRSHNSKDKVNAIDPFLKSVIEALFVSNCQEMFERFGLKKAKVQIWEAFDTEWRTLELEKALTASGAKVRLQLIWDD